MVLKSKIFKQIDLILDQIIKGVDNSKELIKITDELAEEFKPLAYSGNEGVEVKMIQNYTRKIALISESLGIQSKDLTTYRFFECWGIIEARLAQQKRNSNNKK